MAAKYIKGNDFFLYLPINGYNYPVCHSDDCKLDTTRDTIETTTRNGLNGKTYNYYGKPSYQITLSGITNTFDEANPFYVQEALMNAVKLPFIFTDSSNITWSGIALVPNTSFDSPSNNISHYSTGLLVDGELTMVTEGVTPPPTGSAVTILDQFATLLSTIPAPGSYSVLRFDTLDLSGWANPDIIITSQEALA